MNRKAQGIAEQLLLVANIFIVFVLLFENKLVVPTWLQSFGRMHPLLLHFPIVVLLLAFGMEFFRFKSLYASNDFYRVFLHHLWLIGALSAALTIIMGLFLSKEPGYEGEALQWHKWGGVVLLWVATVFYWLRHLAWYKAPVAQTTTIIAAILVILTGHYGATLTHGTNFIVEPMTKNESVAFDKAMVFADVIQPIFEQKCVSCHNPDKTKGGLLLTNQQAILKGGKTGKLFVAGNPEISLLLQRIHLPLEEKKHMPPVGKPQLNPLEIKLLSLWIKGNADFTKKVMDLPANDSLRLIATTFLAPAVEKEESYDFAAADEKTIQKLQTAYRTIAPLAQESPALSVSFFNKNNFTSQKLAELSEIKSQIVALNLPKMPVSDADLNTIATFENLQKLDLNFTDITGKGLKILTSLKKLQRLSVSGTKVTFGDLQPMIKNFGSLTTLTLWETSVSVDEIKQLQKANPSIEFIAGFRDDGSNPIKLNPPQVKNHSMVFKDSVLVQLAHPINGVDIRYTTDNSPPDSIHSLLFTGQTTLQKSATIRAKTYKTGWLGSDEVVFDFFKNTYKPDSLRLLLPLNRVHQAAGANTFFDGILGTFNANSPAWANNWAGVRSNDLALACAFKTPVVLSSVGVRIMEEVETGIFPPELIEVWGSTGNGKMKLLATLKPKIATQQRPHLLMALEAKFKPQAVTNLKIIARPLQKIPDWHGAKGRVALLLVDELFLN